MMTLVSLKDRDNPIVAFINVLFRIGDVTIANTGRHTGYIQTFDLARPGIRPGLP